MMLANEAPAENERSEGCFLQVRGPSSTSSSSWCSERRPLLSNAALRSLFLGQLISCLITGTGVFSSELVSNGISLPMCQSSLNYVLLASHILFGMRRIRSEGLAFAWWRYALWAITDVQANYLVVLAYRYTSVASVMLLDCFAIPCTMLISQCLLGARFTCCHVTACFICVLGLSLTVLSDSMADLAPDSASGSCPWLGDLLVLAGAVLYAFSNVQQESLLKGGCQRGEALGMLGLWGTAFSIIQAGALEGQSLLHCQWSMLTVAYLFGFLLCLFGMYELTSVFLMGSDATLFNLSLLTSDVYSVIYSWQVQHKQISPMYGVAFTTTLSGLIIYHTQPAPIFSEAPSTDSARSCSRSSLGQALRDDP
eukprot:TRINITY_DN6775_c0_g4_i1.p1 TRINITY_DN6775_c0_g4~~TRINITY_DN6775_c0_g4_i1.p1  ORF type:complete len:368 (-),score=35.37 TRINITY_DN6775_c0_g4_i1:38-1141(-)